MTTILKIAILSFTFHILTSLAWGDTTSTLSASATISGVNNLDLSMRNKSDDQVADKIRFSVAAEIAGADQYIRIDFDSNAIGARVILRTDNRNNTPPFTGTGEGAGLVGTTNTAKTVPLLWAVLPDLTGAKAFVFKGDTDPSGTGKGGLPGSTERGAGEAEGLVVDKANPDFETSGVLGYVTVVLPNGNSGLLGNFPTDEDGSGPSTGLRSATSPVFLVLGADFFNAVPQSYGTNQLALDLVVQ